MFSPTALHRGFMNCQNGSVIPIVHNPSILSFSSFHSVHSARYPHSTYCYMESCFLREVKINHGATEIKFPRLEELRYEKWLLSLFLAYMDRRFLAASTPVGSKNVSEGVKLLLHWVLVMLTGIIQILCIGVKFVFEAWSFIFLGQPTSFILQLHL